MISLLLAWAITAAPWMEELADEQLSPYSTIEEKTVSKTYASMTHVLDSKHCPLAFVSFRDGKALWHGLKTLSQKHHVNASNFCNGLEVLHSHAALPDFSLLLWLDINSDRPAYMRHCKVPIFAISKVQKAKHIVLIPRRFMDPNRSKLIEAIQSASQLKTWHEREPQALWHVHAFEHAFQYSPWEAQATPHFLLLCKHFPSHIQAHIPKDNEKKTTWPNRHLMNKLHLPILEKPTTDSLSYRYLISSEQMGLHNDLEWQLFSGSTIFRGPSTQQEWFYPKLKPYEHYIPIALHGEDFIFKLEQSQENDATTQQIAENARAFADQYLTEDAAFSYLHTLLTHYAMKFSLATY